MDREWFFYMLRCKDDSIYSGIALDVAERLKQHNNGTGARYTAVHRPAVLIYWERFNSLSAAMRRETQVKKLPRAKKEQLARRFFDMDVKVQQYLEKHAPAAKSNLPEITGNHPAYVPGHHRRNEIRRAGLCRGAIYYQGSTKSGQSGIFNSGID